MTINPIIKHALKARVDYISKTVEGDVPRATQKLIENFCKSLADLAVSGEELIRTIDDNYTPKEMEDYVPPFLQEELVRFREDINELKQKLGVK